MRNPLKCFSVVFICILICSCNENKIANNRINLIMDATTSTVIDKRFCLDSISFHYDKDSVFMYKHFSNRYFETSFFYSKNDLYEWRDIYDDLAGAYLGKDSILTFSTKEISFVYNSTIEFITTTWDYPFADCKYEIKKIGDDNYTTTKQSLVDTTYKEIYFYNKNYQVSKFINTYKGNICIYTLKE